MTSALFEEIAKYGKLYSPAQLHYEDKFTVTCDKCQRDNIDESFGFGKYDLCLECKKSIDYAVHFSAEKYRNDVEVKLANLCIHNRNGDMPSFAQEFIKLIGIEKWKNYIHDLTKSYWKGTNPDVVYGLKQMFSYPINANPYGGSDKYDFTTRIKDTKNAITIKPVAKDTFVVLWRRNKFKEVIMTNAGTFTTTNTKYTNDTDSDSSELAYMMQDIYLFD